MGNDNGKRVQLHTVVANEDGWRGFPGQQGTVTGTAEDGRLVVEMDNGHTQVVRNGVEAHEI